VLLIVLLAVLLSVPPVFQFLVQEFIAVEAWRHDAEVQIGEVRGSLWEPVHLHNVRWKQTSRAGSVFKVEVTNAEAEFSWHVRELLSGRTDRWFQRLVIDGVMARVELPPVVEPGANPPPTTPKRLKAKWAPNLAWIVPERIEARDVSFVIESNGEALRIEGAGGVFSQVEPAKIRAHQIIVKQPWMTHTFREISGTTKVQDNVATISDVTLEQGVELQYLSTKLTPLGQGHLDADMQVDAFGGSIRAQLRTLDDPLHSGIDANVRFSQIKIAPFASFLSLSDAAGGLIKDAQFNFRGTPRNASRANASLLLTATNFQWDSRQWDSLTVGATLMDRRIEVHELELHQGHNQVSLGGQLTLPPPKTEWWQSDFLINISARIENLTELSALMLPEFKYTAGRMNIDGSVRGQKEQFNGAVVVSGSGITWHNAPIDELSAAIRLKGNEIDVANLDLTNKDDFVRGRGVINILGPKQYWGEFRASVADLATYAAILQKPIVPEPMAGGAVINWSGEGSAKGYSGRFSAHLNKLRTLGSTGAMLHPVNADLEGDYAPGSLMFSKFAVSDDESSVTANVTVGRKVVTLGALKLRHQQEVCLEGDAVLPLDVWQSWPNASWEALLSEKTPGKVNLTATNLPLRPAAQLTGWKWPVDGTVNGTISGEGALGALNTSGHLTLKDGNIPLGWSGKALTAAQGEFSLSGQKLAVEKFQCTAPEQGTFSVQGDIDFSTIRDPALHLKLESEHFQAPLFKPESQSVSRGIQVQAALAVEIAGPASAANVQGNATVTAIQYSANNPLLNVVDNFADLPQPDFFSLVFGSTGFHLPPLFTWRSLPWRNWKFAIDCNSSQPLNLPRQGTLEPRELKLTGTGAAPALIGTVSAENIILTEPISSVATFDPALVPSGRYPFVMEEATVVFRDGFPNDPSVSIRATGNVFDCGVIAYVTGPLSHPIRFLDCEPPLTPEKLRSELQASPLTMPEPVSGLEWMRENSAASLSDVHVYDWDIATPAPETPPPANNNTPTPEVAQ